MTQGHGRGSPQWYFWLTFPGSFLHLTGCISSCTTTRDIGFLLHQVEVRVVGLVLQGKTSHHLMWADDCELTLLIESAIKAEWSHL